MSTTLSAEQQRNAATVRRMYDHERTGDLESWIALWHPAGRQTFPWGDGGNDVAGIDALRRSTARKFATRTDVTIAEQIFPMADPQWIFAIARVSMHFTELDRDFTAELWCRFHFDDDGLLLEHQEVFDGGLVAALTAPRPANETVGGAA